jgi:ribosomal protein S18 acetylase RimI-like enzyme
MGVTVTIRKVERDELLSLLFLSKKTFFDAFYHLNTPGDMEAYAAKFFTKARMTEEFDTPGSAFYFAMINTEVTGYIKLNHHQAQTDLQDPAALEVERIYVSNFHQGKQIGQQLLNFAIQTAMARQLQYIWLGVWEHNYRAIKFYQQHGFQQFGQHNFMLGNDLQVDVLMRKELV